MVIDEGTVDQWIQLAVERKVLRHEQLEGVLQHQGVFDMAAQHLPARVFEPGLASGLEHGRIGQHQSQPREVLRDAQVVALGQLAAGAAHELGTPLATMNVLAEELCADPRLPVAARADLELLRRQIGLCKEIVGGLTQQAGIERAAQPVAADVWLAGLLARWRALHPEAACALDLAGPGAPPRVLPDAAIGQAVANLLDNAARVSPRAMRAVLDWDARALRIAVRDRGPGFPDEILRCAGAQPLASGGAGSGLGLWLARAAIERRGGHLLLKNDGGGIARIELPLGEAP